jgi:apolipoprotein D and lipocalin family protein
MITKPEFWRSALLTLFLILSGGCTSVPGGLTVVSDFDLERYLGKWYEIARLDHKFESGLSNVSATYGLRDDGGIRVVNRGYKEETGKWDETVGKAYFVESPNKGRLKVSFFGPFYGGYNIIELDQVGYQYAIVAGPNRSYLWILARTPEIEQGLFDKLVSNARELGFPTDDLILVEHTR